MASTNKNRELLRLQTWFSSAFPTGAFAYSHGLETAVSDGLITDHKTCRSWLEAVLENGSGWNDAVVLSNSWRMAREKDWDQLDAINGYVIALQPAKERLLETALQGEAFLEAASHWDSAHAENLNNLESAPCLPVAVGAVGALKDIALVPVSLSYLNAFISNLVWIGTRLGVYGQSNALKMLADFEDTLEGIAERAATAGLDDIGGCTFINDMASMRHERQNVRLYRS